MIIEADKTFLMLKIMSPSNISFYNEHQMLINQNGYVWFCRFGKTNVLTQSITRDGNLVFIKESIRNSNKKYVLEFSEVSTEKPDSNYPSYYDLVEKEAALWFKVTTITELPSNFESYFNSASSNNSLEIIYRSMCNSFYIKSNQKFQF